MGGGGPRQQLQDIKIKDDDNLSASIFAANANVVEGSDATFHIWVSGSRHTEDVVVQYETGGTATSGDDYTAPSGTVTIPVGKRSVPIAIGTTADGVHDPNETLVDNPDRRNVGGPHGALRCGYQDRDRHHSRPGYPSGVGGRGRRNGRRSVLQFTVTLSSTTDAPVEVQWETEQYGSLLPIG